MGGKSDNTKFVAEVPLLLAFVNQGRELPDDFENHQNWIDTSRLFDASTVLKGLEYAMPIACAHDGVGKFKRNYKKAQETFHTVCEYFKKNNVPLPDQFYWQATEKNKDDADPSDIAFKNHPYLGISAKNKQAPNLKNHGVGKILKDVVVTERTKGQDYFDWLSGSQLTLLIKEVVAKMLDELDVNTSWSDTGKYVIANTPNGIVITNAGTSKTFTRDQLVNLDFSKKWLRVFGDWYQDRNKEKFTQARQLVDDAIRPVLKQVVKNKIVTDPQHYSSLGAFSTQPYLFVTSDGVIYEVPKFESIINDLEVDVLDTKESGLFGAGIRFVCSVKNKKSNNPGATVEVHFRYHQGTFASTVVFMVQNLQNKENIWTKIT